MADVNGDKIPDLISLADTGAGALNVRLGNGNGTFAAGVPIFPQAGPIAIADFNRDGAADVATTFGPGVVALLNLSQPPAPLTVVSAASFLPGPLAPDSIASAFGEMIPPGSGSGAPLTAGVIAVTVQDSSGANRSATLLYLSSTQINFLVPAATALGPATVTIDAAGRQLSAQVQIAAVAPSLFTVGASIAAAYAVQVAPGGAQTVEPVFTSQNGTVAAVPIERESTGAGLSDAVRHRLRCGQLELDFGNCAGSECTCNLRGSRARLSRTGPDQPAAAALARRYRASPA